MDFRKDLNKYQSGNETPSYNDQSIIEYTFVRMEKIYSPMDKSELLQFFQGLSLSPYSLSLDPSQTLAEEQKAKWLNCNKTIDRPEGNGAFELYYSGQELSAREVFSVWVTGYKNYLEDGELIHNQEFLMQRHVEFLYGIWPLIQDCVKGKWTSFKG